MKTEVNTKNSKLTIYNNDGKKLTEREFAKSEKLSKYIEKIGHDIKVTYDFNEIDDEEEAAIMALKLLDGCVKRVLDDGAVGELKFVKE